MTTNTWSLPSVMDAPEPESPSVGQRVEIRSSLAHLPDDDLDRITSRSNVFFDRRWFRLIDSVSLPDLVRGHLEMRYAIVWRGAVPVAVCPFLITRSSSIHVFYSLEKYFFTAWWWAGVEKQLPGKASHARWARRAVNVCAFLARAARAGLSGWVLAVSPLSHRSDIALAPMSDEDERAARDAILETLQDVATEEGLPLCFLGVPDESAKLRQSLAGRDFEEVFVGHDNVLELGCESFDGYLAGFRSDARRLFKREIRDAAAAGVRFETTTALAELGPVLERLYRATSSRYGDDHIEQPPAFWSALERHLGGHAEAVVGFDAKGPVGFSLLLHKGRELWFDRVGRLYDGANAKAPVYFNLAFYEPVKRALAHGAKRVWLGFGAWEAKRRRGAVGHPIYSAFWFPSRWSRALLVPYLRTFGRVSRNAMSELEQPSSYLKAPRA